MQSFEFKVLWKKHALAMLGIHLSINVIVAAVL